jgi:alpha-tubulin suppressor-like RCC1 family protein
MITIRALPAFLLLLTLAAAPSAGAAGVAAGYKHSLALSADGTVRSWGDDSAGALGIGRSLTNGTPIVVAGLSGVTQVVAAGEYTAALKGDGTVWTWGRNENGQLGDGSLTARSIPVRVVGLANVVQIAAGRFHMIARRSDGSVWTWGANNYGELGGDGYQRSTPAPVAGIPAAVEIAAGTYHSLARTADGRVWAWGANDTGQLGDGTQAEPYRGRTQPGVVPGLQDVVQLAAGASHSLALRSDGSVWAWGNNASGQVGDGGPPTVRLTPVRVAAVAGVVEISAGPLFTTVRSNDGRIMAWGDGGNGQLGDGNYQPVPLPVQLPMTGIAQLAAGFLHSLALASDGGLWAWGSNGSGQLGDGTTTSRSIPSRVEGITGLAAVAVGAAHSVALRADGTVLTWGENAWGQLGNAALTFRSVPSVVPGLAGVTAVSGGGTMSLALTAQGTVYEWGNLIGYGVGYSSPRLVELNGATAISAGGYHAVAIVAGGALRAWGSNYRGRLGDGGEDGTYTPIAVANLTGVTRVSAGLSHTLAVRSDGTVWAWGENDFGQLGDRTTTDRNAPVQVAGIQNAIEVAAGPQHSLVLLSDGSVLAWGRNYEGQLGEGNEPMRLLPTRVNGLPAATKVVAGRDFSVALAGGSVWAWGVNYNGGIGCRSCDGRNGPVRIAGIERATSISTFAFHIMAMRDDGAVYSWGGNSLGELGDGTLIDREYPVVVLHEGGTGSVAANDWFLDLVPAAPTQIGGDDVPNFLVVASTAANSVVADIRYRAQDVGSSASTFVFAMAPTTVIRGALKDLDPRFKWKARDATGKAGEVQCGLAQLNAQGQLVAVSAESLRAYASGVLSAQGQAVNILNAITPDVKGATFFVGYGPNGNAMLTNGTTRGVVSVSGDVSCKPQSPQTGWWYNPAEGGRGFSIEARGNRLFFGAFHYDTAGNAVWNYAGGPTSLDGSLFTSDFVATSGGQTLTGPYRPPAFANAGTVTLIFSDATHGTIAWPGGTTAVERLPFVPNGLTAPAQAGVPEAGWWWNPSESGRGFFIEWQNGWFHIAGYMYDASGRPTWYLSAFPSPDPTRISGNWWLFGNGQAPGQPYRPAVRVNDNVGSLEVQFTNATTGTLTLPNGTRVPFVRMPF